MVPARSGACQAPSEGNYLSRVSLAPPVPAAPRTPATHDPYAALRHRDFRLLLAGRMLGTVGYQMLDVAVGWELYERTHSALALGIVGLVLVVPVVAFALPAGHLADQHERKRIVVAGQLALFAAAIALATISFTRAPVPLIYIFLAIAGTALSFARPAVSALLPQTVPAADFANAVTWNTSGWEIAAIVGPAAGGALIGIGHDAGPAYLVSAALVAGYAVCVGATRHRPPAHTRQPMSLASLAAGIRFVWTRKLILSALTLDLFAVLFGGATTLLPIFAKDILHVGPAGFGWLRAAPSLGALAMAIWLTHRPPMRHAGRSLLWAVAGFGVATIGFGLSRWFPLSLALLVVLGALDNVSVVVRWTLVQLRTPDPMRGRVSAVNGVFVDTSNELGGFESGVTAAAFGPIISVVGGGIITILVVLGVAWRWPELRKLGPLYEPDGVEG